MEEGRKRVIAIMAAILASRKLNEFGNTIKVPVTIMAIQKAVTWANKFSKRLTTTGQI